jgi:membrane-associated phospholipid phosphatase
VTSRVRRYALISFLVASATGALLSYFLIDDRVIAWLLRHPASWCEEGWVKAFRQMGKAYVLIWLLLLWSCVTDNWRPTITTLIALVLVSLGVCSLKATVHRDRPNRSWMVATERETPEPEHSVLRGVSFPSGDTAVAFAVAQVLASFSPAVGAPVLFAAAGAIGALRVAALVHYPSDVFAGAFIGVLAGFCAVRVAASRWPRNPVRVKVYLRVLLVLLLALVIPAVGPRLHMDALLVFLDVFTIPVAALMLVGVLVYQVHPRWRGRARGRE